MGELFIFSTFLGMLFFFLPVFVYTDGYLDVRENKAWFSLSLYKHFKLFGGYAQLEKEGIAVHLTKKKAVLFEYGKMADTRKMFEITDGFQPYRFHITVETGGAQSPVGVMIASALQAFGGAAFTMMKGKYPFLSLKNGTILADEPCLKLTVQAVTIFNGLVLTMAITKKILEAILKWIRKRKSTALWKKRQSA